MVISVSDPLFVKSDRLLVLLCHKPEFGPTELKT